MSCCKLPSTLARKLYHRTGLLLFLLVATLPARANDLKSIAERWTENLKGMGPLLIITFAMLGLICVGIGLHKFTRARKSHGQIMEGLAYAIVGSLLLSLTAFSGFLSGTSFGSNEASSGLNALGVN